MECLSVCCELWNPKKNIRSLCCRSSTRFAVVDTMRAASSILLVLFHTYFIGTSVLNFDSGMEKLNFHAWGSYMTNAHHCVDGFLVVSGFCICYFIVKEQHSRNAQLKWFAFMFRRLMRVTPGLIAALLINRTVMAIFGGGNKNCVDYWWRDVLYINNLYPIQDMCVDYTWSLGLEVQFYVFCATLLALLWRWPWAQKLAAWLVVLGSVAFRWYMHRSVPIPVYLARR
jgi:peptidoglycan/LPS O-acetylase OafA/YrhL